MSVLAEIRVVGEGVVLRELLDRFPGLELRLQPVVPTENEFMPLLWIRGADPTAVVQTLEAQDTVETAEVVSRDGDQALLEVAWNEEFYRLLAPLVESHARVLEAHAEDGAWTFRLQFQNHEALRTFEEGCSADDVHLDLQRLGDPELTGVEPPLSSAQRDAMSVAYERGYWKVPREVTVAEVADQLGISAQAVSERLRRGINNLVGAHLDHGSEDESEG